MKMKDNISVYLFSLSRLLLVIGYIVATDPNIKYEIFSTQWYGYSLLVLLSLTNGYFTSAAYAIASQRCENKNKKTSGYLMTVSLFLGLVYGGLISATCLENKTVPA
jgi:DNA-binding transcriptional regulator PaaX